MKHYHDPIKAKFHPSSSVTSRASIDTIANPRHLNVKDLLFLVILLAIDLLRQLEINPHLILVLEEESDCSLCRNEVEVDHHAGLKAPGNIGGCNSKYHNLYTNSLGLRVNRALDLWRLALSEWAQSCSNSHASNSTLTGPKLQLNACFLPPAAFSSTDGWGGSSNCVAV